MRHLPRVMQVAVPLLRPLFQDAAAGALPTLRAATDPAALGGQYYGPDGPGGTRGYPKVVPSSDQSHDTDLAASAVGGLGGTDRGDVSLD